MEADVILQRRLPRSRDAFTYRIPPSEAGRITAGRWAIVPFRASKIAGVVWSFPRHRRKGKTLLIARLLDVPTMPTQYRTLLTEFAHTHAVSLSHALDTLTPAPVERPVAAHTPAAVADVPVLRLTPEAAATVRNTARDVLRERRAHPARVQFVATPSFAVRIAVLLTLLRAETTRQQLVVEPTRADAQRVAPYLQRHFGDRVHVLHGGLAAGAFWRAWHGVGAQHDVILVATRRAMFAPLPNMAAVYVDQETDRNHKQEDMNPRYDARLLALRLAALLGAQAVALDSVPSLSLAARRTVRRHETIRVPYRRTLVDMRRERLARNFSPLADAVVDALQSKGPHLVFQNRRGNVRALHCRECGWTFRCPRCDTPLAEIVGTFRCPRCAASSPPPLRCPLCRGVRLVGSGWGTERLESFLRERFPSRTLARVDREQPHLPPHSDLIVATEQIFSIPFLPRVQHLVLASLDALRERPDFAAAEDAFSAVERLIALCMPRAAVFIQTFSPESAFARQVAERDDRAFLREEMALRRELRLPPTVTVVKLLLKQRSQRAADDAANRLVRDLRRRAGVRASLTVDDPRTPSPDPAHGWYRRVVLLTCLPGARSSATLRNVLRTLPEHWLVDAHPRTFSP